MPTKDISVNESVLESGRTGWFISRKLQIDMKDVSPFYNSMITRRIEAVKLVNFQRQSSKIH